MGLSCDTVMLMWMLSRVLSKREKNSGAEEEEEEEDIIYGAVVVRGGPSV